MRVSGVFFLFYFILFELRRQPCMFFKKNFNYENASQTRMKKDPNDVNHRLGPVVFFLLNPRSRIASVILSI